MSIIAKSAQSPFADFVNVSFPLDSFEEAAEAALGVVYEAGGYQQCDGLCRLDNLHDSGTVKYGRKHRVGWLSTSGAALGVLRSKGLFHEFLWALGAVPHRVTTLHAALDLQRDAPKAIQAVRRRAKAGRISFGRKAVSGRDVKWLLGKGIADDRETGTIYLGRRTSDVWAKVYDKRHERLSVFTRNWPEGSWGSILEFQDPGPLTRYELCIGRHVGVSLRDVADPTAVFWHFAGKSLLRAPAGIAAWEPVAEGYELPKPNAPNYAKQLEMLLERSPDIRKAFVLADKLGPYGRQVLANKLASLFPAAEGSAVAMA